MSRDHYIKGGYGRDDYPPMDRGEYQRPGLIGREREYEMDRQGPYTAGLLGEGPGGGGGGGAGLGLGGSDSLTAGLQEQLLQHKRLEQQLNLRESQLALASNLLQQQNKMLGDIHSGPGLMGPAPPNIPSLLEGVPRGAVKRGNEGMRLDNKRSRFEDREPVGVRRNDHRDVSGEHGRRRREDQYDPEYPTGDRNFGKHMNSRRHQEQLRGASEAIKSNMARNKAQQHLRKMEGQDYCRICDEEVKIPFEHHKRTTIHKKRYQQVNMGCGWCDVHNFTNFREVLKHRETKKHMENEKKNKTKEPERRDRNNRRPNKPGQGDKEEDAVVVGEKKSDRRNSRRSNGTSRSSSATSKSAPPKKKTEVKPKEDPNVFNVKSLEEAEKVEFDAERAIGQNLVIPATGFFCKLCHKFYANEEAAKVAHCKSQAHFDKYKATMIAKFQKKAEAEAKAKAEAEVKAKEAESKAKEEAESKAKKEAEGKAKEGEAKVKTEVKETDKEAEKSEETKVKEIKEEDKETNDGDQEEKTNDQDKTMESDFNISLEEPESVNVSAVEPIHEGEDMEEDGQESENQEGEGEEDDLLGNDDELLGNDEEKDDAIDDQDKTECNTSKVTDADLSVVEDDETENEKAKATTKSPRGRSRVGRSRGGKARRGRK